MNKVFLISGMVAGIMSLPAVPGICFLTEKTIWDKLSEDAIPELKEDPSLNNVWSKLKEKLPDEFLLKNQQLKDIKKVSSSNESEDKLKGWCFAKYKEIYWNLFNKNNDELLEDVGKACILKIKDYLESSSQINFEYEQRDNHRDNFIKRMETLKKHYQNKSNPPLDKDLEIIDANNPESWVYLWNWCGYAYDRGYQGEKSNMYRLVEIYCKRSHSENINT